MTTEQKAAAYDEVLKRAEQIHRFSSDIAEIKRMEDIFPELKESEDERIRKEIIESIKGDMVMRTSKDKELALAWLEKQKPVEYVKGDDYGIDGLWHAQRILEGTLGKVDGYQSDDGILDHKAAIGAIKTIIEQKPAEWSEEDERLRQSCINHIEEELERVRNDKYGHSEIISDLKESCGERIKWLKSLSPKKQWKPSDEDEAFIRDLLDYFDEDRFLKHEVNDVVKWLKSLCPQNHFGLKAEKEISV